MDWTWIEDPMFLGTLWHVAVAMVLGGLIGIERELAGKPAGFRTMMLVAGCSALLVRISQVLISNFDRTAPVEADPVRVIQAIVIGISFLGAGTIFRDAEEGVEGLTTAATILTASAIGITVAIDQIPLAIVLTVLVLVVLGLLGGVERLLTRRRKRRAPTHPPPRRRKAEGPPKTLRGGTSSDGLERR